ncbi:hypothetical protein GTW25_10060 [Aliihoeflea aestuarii]|jgi:hypothetical protein|uniref:hypothetical protein n=1 Tax=Aliihoeflea aestuarii TaxID=453840 RepID=UPI002093F328|nr:hypothetical protein [Aliihoeflea aestuarii]MCO6391372.1 hypothetical protein [Aliihoeflea aestuarii]
MISLSRSTRALGLCAAVGALAFGTGHSIPAMADDAHEAHYRLFVGDHADGVVRAFDIHDGAAAGTFEIDQTPALTRSESGRTLFAVQGDTGKVAVISTGISFEDHGDHADLKVEDAALLDVAIEGVKPAHVVEGSGRIALFDDGSGDVSLFAESGVLDGNFEPRILKPGAAHHGLAAPMGDHLVVSVPHENADEPRVGLKVVDADGDQVGEVVSCPGVHGQAQSARLFAFGCRDGIVIASPGTGGEAPTLRHVPTADLGEGNVSTLKGGTAMTYFLGNYGPSSVVVIEPGDETGFTKIDLPTRRVDFALDPALPRNAYVLTEDGQLHLIDIVAGTIAQSAAVTEPYSMDGHWRDPRPRLAVAGDRIALTDPREGVVRLISTETLEETGTIEIEGTPYTIVTVGGSGAVHDHE